MYRSNAISCLLLRTSPVVFRKITAAYLPSESSLKKVASRVVSTSKPCSRPSFCIAAMPVPIDEWTKPAVLLKTSTLGLPERSFLHEINEKIATKQANQVIFFIYKLGIEH